MSRVAMPGSASAHANLLKACRDLLALHGIPSWRTGQQAARRPDGQWRIPGMDRGCPDLIAVCPPNGHLLAVEAKTGRARTSLEQRAAAGLISASGGTFLVVRSVSDLDEWLAESGQQKIRTVAQVEDRRHQDGYGGQKPRREPGEGPQPS